MSSEPRFSTSDPSFTPIDFTGRRITRDELGGDVDELLALVEGDKVVSLLEHINIRVGSGYGCGSSTTSGTWVYVIHRQLPAGTYGLIKSLPGIIATETARRQGLKKPFKSFVRYAPRLGPQLIGDGELLKEALEEGLERQFKFL